MDEKEQCLFHYNKFISLLEEDLHGITQCIQGDMAETYKSVLKKEIEAASNYLKNLHFM